MRLKFVNVGGDDDIIVIDEMGWFVWANGNFDDLMRNR